MSGPRAVSIPIESLREAVTSTTASTTAWHITTKQRAKAILADEFKAVDTPKGRGLSFAVDWLAARALFRTARRMMSFRTNDAVVAWFVRMGLTPASAEATRAEYEARMKANPGQAWRDSPGGLYLTMIADHHPSVAGGMDKEPARRIPWNEFLWADIGQNLLRHASTAADIVAIEVGLDWDKPIPHFPPGSVEAELFVPESKLWRARPEDILDDPKAIEPPHLSFRDFRAQFPDKFKASHPTYKPPVEEATATLRAKDVVAHGAEGRAFEAVFIKALSILGLQFEEAAGATAAVWDIKPVGEGWSKLLAGAQVNLKIKGTRWLFTARAVYDAMKIGAANVGDGAWTASRAEANVIKAVRDTFKAKGIVGTAFLKPKDDTIQRAIETAVRKKDKTALRELFAGPNFSIKKLGRGFSVRAEVEWAGFDCEGSAPCAHDAAKREGSWQRTAKVFVDGGVRAAPFHIRTETKWNFDPRREDASGGPVVYPNVIFRDANPDDTGPHQAVLLAAMPIGEMLSEATGAEIEVKTDDFTHGSVRNGADDALFGTTIAVQEYGEGKRWKAVPPMWAKAIKAAKDHLRELDEYLAEIAKLGHEAENLDYRIDDAAGDPSDNYKPEAGEKALGLLTKAADLWIKKYAVKLPTTFRAAFEYGKRALDSAFGKHKHTGAVSELLGTMVPLVPSWEDFAKADALGIGHDIQARVMALKGARAREEPKGETSWVADAVYYYASALDTDFESQGGEEIETNARNLAAMLTWIIVILPRLAFAEKEWHDKAIERAIIKGETMPQGVIPPRKRAASWEYDTGRTALSWAKKALKPTPLRQLPDPIRKTMKALTELGEEMQEIEKDFRADFGSMEDTPAIEKMIALGQRIQDAKIQPRLTNITEPLGQMEGGRGGSYDDPLAKLRNAVSNVNNMAQGEPRLGWFWHEEVRTIVRELSMVKDSTTTPDGLAVRHESKRSAAWAFDKLYRGEYAPPRTSFPEMADALIVAAQLLPYLYSAAALRAQTNPGDIEIGAGKVGPWALRLLIPAGWSREHINKRPKDVEKDRAEKVAYFHHAATLAYKLYRAADVGDHALAGPIILKWRDPDDATDKREAAGYYYPTNNDLIVYADQLGVDSDADIKLEDAVWTLIHEIAHRVYYRGLTTNGRLYWHTLIQKMGDPMTDAMKKLCIATAVHKGARDVCSGSKCNITTTGDVRADTLGVFSADSVLANAADKDKSFASTIWWWYEDRYRHDQFIDWLQHKRYTHELPTEYANVTPIEAWPESVANTLLRRPRTKEGRNTSEFIRAVIRKMFVSQLREGVEEAVAVGQRIEEIGRAGPIRVSVVREDRPEVDVDYIKSLPPSTASGERAKMVNKLAKLGVGYIKNSDMSDLVARVREAYQLIRRAGVPDRALQTRVVWDYGWEEDTQAEYSTEEGWIRAAPTTTVEDLIHELSHHVYFKALGGAGRARWRAFVESIGQPLNPIVQRVVFASFLAQEWQDIYGAGVKDFGTDEAGDESWADFMRSLEHVLDKNLLGNMAIEDYNPNVVLKKIAKTDSKYEQAEAMLEYWRRSTSTGSPRELIKWLGSKTYSRELPSLYANTDPEEAFAEAMADILWNERRLDAGERTRLKVEVMKALGVVHERVEEAAPSDPRGEEDAVLAWLVKDREMWREKYNRQNPTWPPSAVRRGVMDVDSDRIPAVLARLARRGKVRKAPGGYELIEEAPREVLMPLATLTESRASLIESLRAAGLDEAGFGETSVSVTLRVPASIARQFPDKGGDVDPTPPHVTILVVGEVPVREWERVQSAVEKLAADTRPFTASLDGYGEFRPKPGLIVSHIKVDSSGLLMFYKRLLVALREAGSGFEVKWPHFKPHVTLSYGAEPFTGKRPAGSWRVSAIEVWRGTKSQMSFALGAPVPAGALLAAGREYEVTNPLLEAEEDEIGAGAHAIHTNPSGEKFWGAQGAGVLPIARATGRVLVSFRSSRVNEPHTWGVFGGAIDLGEDPKRAAHREMKEELGCCNDVTLIPGFVFVSKGGGFKYYNFIGLVNDEFKPRLDWETEKAEWMTFEELTKLRPKHFGLDAFLKNSMPLFRKHLKAPEEGLTERSFEEKDIPEHFFLTTYFSPRAIHDLKDGTLDGVEGIAADGRVLVSVGAMGTSLGGLIIAMPGKDTVAINKLSRVMYDNPEYWIQDDFKAARRILNSHDAASAGGKILHSASEAAKKHGLFAQTLGEYQVPREYLEWGAAPVTNLSTWAKRLTQNVKTLQGSREKGSWPYLDRVAALSVGDWIEFIKLGTAKLARRFVIEGEWLVKNKKLRLPASTELRVLISNRPGRAAEVESFLAELGDRYRIERVGQHDWDTFLDMLRKEEQERWARVVKEDQNQNLDERSFILSDIPKNFRVVFDLGSSEEYGDAKAWKSLASGKLEHIHGISDTGNIEPQFLNVARNAELVMPGHALAALNKITRIMYDNPNYMLSKDAWALRRIYQADTRNRERAIDHALRNLFEYMFNRMKKTGTKEHSAVVYAVEYSAFWQTLSGAVAKLGKPIEGVKSLVKLIREAMKHIGENKPSWSEETVVKETAKWPDSEWEKWIEAAIKYIGPIYANEGEWVVKGDALKIPPGSVLRVLTGHEIKGDIPEKVWQRYLRLFAGRLGTKPNELFQDDVPENERVPLDDPTSFMGWQYALQERGYIMDRFMALGITKKYRVEFVSRAEFRDAQKRWWSARDLNPAATYEPPAGKVVEHKPAAPRPRSVTVPLDNLRK